MVYGIGKLQDFYPIIYNPNTLISINCLKDIREFWRDNKDFWFSHKPINEWPLINNIYQDTLDINLRLILHYDQIYRHPNPNIRESDKQFAFRFATHLALRIIHSSQFEEAIESEKVFILLTLRHNKSLLLKELALKKALKLNPSPLLIRFLNATIWDIHNYKHKKGYTPESSIVLENTWQHLLQSPKSESDVNIKDIHEKLHQEFSSIISLQNSTKIAVSISGGVDSMVAAYIAKEVCNSQNKELILLHINYNNRECCEQECDLLRDFSEKLHVPLYIRKITEIQRIRQTQFRTLYEDITRKIRFSFYSYFECPVILGHNLDDCFENVFQNLSKQIHFDNLFGMKLISMEQDVTILRPMLTISKKDIYTYADYSGIPHLYDSTPEWSRRGQMRDILIPGIQTFDKQILPGLQEFIKRSIFLEQQWNESFKQYCSSIKYIENNTNNKRKEYIIPRNTFFETNANSINFWTTLWFSLKKRSRPSNKSFQNLIGRLQTNAKGCNLNLEWKIIIKPECLILQSICD
jgi:tRNA(Ile)-lysidine synthetase-like protein